jgi:hypothetical protein
MKHTKQPRELTQAEQDECDANARRREELTRRLCNLMNWEYKTCHVYTAIRKAAKAEAVIVGLDKLEEIIARLDAIDDDYERAEHAREKSIGENLPANYMDKLGK